MANELAPGDHVISTNMAYDLLLMPTKMADDPLMQNVKKYGG